METTNVMKMVEQEEAITRMYVVNKEQLNAAREPIRKIKERIARAAKKGQYRSDLQEALAKYKRKYGEVRKAGIKRILDYRLANNFWNNEQKQTISETTERQALEDTESQLSSRASIVRDMRERRARARSH